ncbi:MAG: DNA methylase [Candidatus Taylorbacteria bacterium CG11_big_fil_rev_8_21_14_0_20_46_11]|uniref:DNA methylase n=1 Tax=Candidatus Taylorbacteria bacterium CG11_big_fil_rev_8_21_14_0_20_46_11 TaxID=1975025 RepID=A0A2H0KAS1_9BACT|nr:MAG: DNA methylase [Candidatus Taylorbacteria bacterium CG11_big_fil_rev_8_21_14_0_20_46_11]
MKLYYSPRLKSTAQNLRKAENLAEVLLWKELRARKLGVQFLRQRPIDKYVVDFYCHRLNLAIEIDGVSHDSKVEEDVIRQKMLESKGVRFLRFNDKDVRYNLDGVLREITEFVKSSGSSE